MPNIEASSEERDISPIANKGVTHITSRDTVERKDDLGSGTSSVSRISYAQKVSARLSKNISPTANKGVTHIISSNTIGRKDNLEDHYLKQCAKPEVVVPSSCINFSPESKSVSSGLYFEGVKYDMSMLYKQVAIEFCSKLRKFRKLHATYCMRLINQIFKIENDQLVVSDKVETFLSRCTSNIEVLLFVLKVFLLVNLSTLYGGKKIADYMRYCVIHFYNQSLLDRVILDLIRASKEKGYVKDINGIFDFHCKSLCNIPIFEPYSGEFFQQVFNICYDFALIEECGEYEELVDFVEWSCMAYCGHMVNMLCRMLFYDCGVEKTENLVRDNLKAFIFCQRCYDLKKTVVHMYHPAEGEVPRNVSDIINIPLLVWRSCTRRIQNIVESSINEGKLGFGIFVKDMISVAKELILNPSTRRCYKRDIEMYNTKLSTANSLLPLKKAMDFREKPEPSRW